MENINTSDSDVSRESSFGPDVDSMSLKRIRIIVMTTLSLHRITLSITPRRCVSMFYCAAFQLQVLLNVKRVVKPQFVCDVYRVQLTC